MIDDLDVWVRANRAAERPPLPPLPPLPPTRRPLPLDRRDRRGAAPMQPIDLDETDDMLDDLAGRLQCDLRLEKHEATDLVSLICKLRRGIKESLAPRHGAKAAA